LTQVTPRPGPRDIKTDVDVPEVPSISSASYAKNPSRIRPIDVPTPTIAAPPPT
jgi:hypothetical protein